WPRLVICIARSLPFFIVPLKTLLSPSSIFPPFKKARPKPLNIPPRGAPRGPPGHIRTKVRRKKNLG
ncbi:uncharacterized protein K441DRAFT_657943, partial [Cenococcum geophilum 1.58]|uniref:uncharacterized protein n=1 Tax=Cenococcum geophilum 1.58 TaxID=794803 RepID=UPI00358E7465